LDAAEEREVTGVVAKGVERGKGSESDHPARTLEKSVFEELESLVRHYRRLVRTASLTPLRVEEHTAQISPTKRISIEREFRSTSEDGVDVISGATTFELLASA